MVNGLDVTIFTINHPKYDGIKFSSENWGTKTGRKLTKNIFVIPIYFLQVEDVLHSGLFLD